MEAIAKDEALIDPSELFRANASQGEIDAEDAAYWNVEVADTGELPAADPLLTFAMKELEAEVDTTDSLSEDGHVRILRTPHQKRDSLPLPNRPAVEPVPVQLAMF